jgi:hypothetical protein
MGARVSICVRVAWKISTNDLATESLMENLPFSKPKKINVDIPYIWTFSLCEINIRKVKLRIGVFYPNLKSK